MSNISPSTPAPLVFVNGEVNDQVSVYDRGFAYGDGVFETLLVVGAKAPFRNLHWQRLQLGCTRLRINLDEEFVNRCVDSALLRLEEVKSDEPIPLKTSILKIIVTRGVGQRGYKPGNSQPPTMIVQLSEKKSTAINSQGVDVCLCKHRLPINPVLAGIKHLNRLDNVLASMEVDSEQYQEGLVFDAENFLVEGISRNVFLVKNNVLITPLLDRCGVAGVGRRLIIEKYADAAGLRVEERRVTAEELNQTDEVLLVNSVEGIWPVKSISGAAINVGPVALQLQRLWQQDLIDEL